MSTKQTNPKPQRYALAMRAAWKQIQSVCCVMMIPVTVFVLIGLAAMTANRASAAILVYDADTDGDGGDGTTWTSALNWFLADPGANTAGPGDEPPVTTSGARPNQAPASGDTLYIGAAQEIFTNYNFGGLGTGTITGTSLSDISPVFNPGGNQTVASLNVAVVPFNDVNNPGNGLLPVKAYVSFDNGGSAFTLSTSTLSIAGGPHTNSNRQEGVLTIGNTSSGDPMQTVTVTSSATVGLTRNSDGFLTVQEGGTLNLGTSPSARASLSVGLQSSGSPSSSIGTVEAKEGGTFSAYLSSLFLGRNSSTYSGSLTRLGEGTLDLTDIILGQDGNVLDVNVGHLANLNENTGGGGDGVKATMNLGEGTARFGTLTLGRAAGNTDLLLSEANVNLEGTILQIDTGVAINPTGTMNVTVQGDNAGLDLGLGATITLDGELNIIFEPTSLAIGETYWGLRALGDRVSELESLSGLNIINNQSLGTPTIFFQEGYTYIGFNVIPEPSSFVLIGFGTLIVASRQRRRRCAVGG